MAKFQRPNLPKDITEEERRAVMFDALYSLDLSDKLEKRDNDKLSYLGWANAWAEFKRAYPNAEYRIIKNPESNLPYFNDPEIGIMVYTEVTADNQSYEMWLPVMNGGEQGDEGTILHLPSLRQLQETICRENGERSNNVRRQQDHNAVLG